MLQLFILNAKLQYENQKLKQENEALKAKKWAFTSDTEHKINKLIRAIKCRDEIPNHIFLGEKEMAAIKTLGSIDMNNPDPDDPMWRQQSYLGFTVIKVNKASFVDVSTVACRSKSAKSNGQ